jgi:hypothetical protein
MSLKTRLDGRSEGNDRFEIIDEEGNVLAEIKLLNPFGVTLDISTGDGLCIKKPSGWSSK